MATDHFKQDLPQVQLNRLLRASFRRAGFTRWTGLKQHTSTHSAPVNNHLCGEIRTAALVAPAAAPPFGPAQMRVDRNGAGSLSGDAADGVAGRRNFLWFSMRGLPLNWS